MSSSLKPGVVVRVQGKVDGEPRVYSGGTGRLVRAGARRRLPYWALVRDAGVGQPHGKASKPNRQRATWSTSRPANPTSTKFMQVNPKADQDTIQRVYRILAQRYHPDHAETGNAAMFRWLTQAYKTLGDPESRAAYDVQRAAEQVYRVKIFSKPADAEGIEGERRKRQGILHALYTQRMNSPEHAWLTIAQLEELLGVPREHLEFPLWYLREQQLVQRSDSGRFVITCNGVDRAEASTPSEVLIRRPLLEAPAA